MCECVNVFVSRLSEAVMYIPEGLDERGNETKAILATPRLRASQFGLRWQRRRILCGLGGMQGLGLSWRTAMLDHVH